MNPAKAMGTFLRVWRREWAGMSRAQLALAVSAACHKRKTVTADMVYAWEDGQPPRTAEELVALTKVMRRHSLGNPPRLGGLTRHEVKQFREVALASLAGRQYAELFDDDSIAHRQDVEEIAEALYPSRYVPPLNVNIVHLVAWIAELEGALRSGVGPKVSGNQDRRQRAALAFLRATLGRRHMVSARFRQAIAVRGTNAEFVQAHFGPSGIGGRISVLTEREGEAHGTALLASGLGRPANAARCALRFSEWASSQGDQLAALGGFLGAVGTAGAFPKGEHTALLQKGERLLATLESLDPAHVAEGGYCHLFTGALSTGALDMAARYLSKLEHWPSMNPMRHGMWEAAVGRFAQARGDYIEATAHCERAMGIAKKHDVALLENQMTRALDDCDRARMRGRHISLPRDRSRRRRRNGGESPRQT